MLWLPLAVSDRAILGLRCRLRGRTSGFVYCRQRCGDDSANKRTDDCTDDYFSSTSIRTDVLSSGKFTGPVQARCHPFSASAQSPLPMTSCQTVDASTVSCPVTSHEHHHLNFRSVLGRSSWCSPIPCVVLAAAGYLRLWSLFLFQCLFMSILFVTQSRPPLRMGSRHSPAFHRGIPVFPVSPPLRYFSEDGSPRGVSVSPWFADFGSADLFQALFKA